MEPYMEWTRDLLNSFWYITLEERKYPLVGHEIVGVEAEEESGCREEQVWGVENENVNEMAQDEERKKCREKEKKAA